MSAPNENPSLTPFLRGFLVVEVLALFAAGGGLFFLTDLARAQWPWDIPPFNARFVGAVYLSSLAAAGMLLLTACWAPARLLLPMLFTFTSLVLVMSLIWWNKFLFDRWATWGWFILYVLLPISSAYYFWQYRRLPPADPTPVPAAWRYALLAFGVLLGLYGVLQILAPEAASTFWPWKIDAFHGHLYSAIFVAAAVGALMLSHVAAPVEFFTLGLTYAVLGFFAILGVVIVDASAHSVNWSAPGTWAWTMAFAAILIAGVGLMAQSRARR